MDLIAKHVFVDFENVCEIDTTLLQDKNVAFTLLLGAGQTKLDVGLVQQLLLHAASVQLVRLSSRAKNAVDFALAYYLGQAAAAAPHASFYIVSKDTGFDPLIDHLLSKSIRVARYTSFAEITDSELPGAAITSRLKASPKLKPASSNGEALIDRALAHLRKLAVARPKRRKSLVSFLTPHLGPDITEDGVNDVIESLCKAGHVIIDPKGAVTYNLGQPSTPLEGADPQLANLRP